MTRKEILAEAEKIVCNDRNVQYGEPEDNFNTIAKFWSTFLDIHITAPESRQVQEEIRTVGLTPQVTPPVVVSLCTEKLNRFKPKMARMTHTAL